jgi:hypothetical protein
MTAQETFQKNVEAYQKLGQRSMKTMQSLMHANLEQSKQVQDVYTAMLEKQFELVNGGFKLYETEMSNWLKAWGDFFSTTMPEAQPKK